MSVNITGNNIFIKPYEQYELKTYAQNNADNPLLSFSANTDTLQRSTQDYQETETLDISSLREDLEKAKSEQGILGKLWDGFKNLTRIGAGSSKAQQAIEDYENGLITAEEMQKAVDGYKEGQKMAVDVVADMASGMISIVAFGAATAVLGPVGALLIAGAVGAASKVGIKAGDAAIGGREYSGKDLLYDGITGGINGLLGPITNGIGNTVTKTIATKFGLTVLKEGAEEVAEQGLKQGFKQFAKSVVLNQSDDIIGGTLKQRMIALGAGMASDGALGGASDNMVRAALEGEDILKAGAEGFVGGLIMAPIIGGGMKLAGKAGKALNNKITTSRVLPDGMATNFRQGATGDCALLSTIDGMMANPNTANKIKNSITRTVFGDYDVKIGDRIIRVSKNALSDEILSDTTGIKIFEVAYKQMGGSIDGEFAEVVAKQFGLNPIHITSDSITDELLERISKNSDNLILSLGMDGHYYSIQGIDPQTKMITLVNPYDTSKTLKMSFDEVKAKGASIDGGSIKATDFPNTERNADEVGLRGGKQISTSTRNIQDCIDNLIAIDDSGELNEEIVEQLFEILKLADGTIPEVYYKKIEWIIKHYNAGINDCIFDNAENLNSILEFIKATNGLVGIENIDNINILPFLNEIMEDGEYFSAEQIKSLEEISKAIKDVFNNADTETRIKISENLIGKIYCDSNGKKTQEIIEQIHRLRATFQNEDLKTALIEIYNNNLPEAQIKTKLLNNRISGQIYDLIQPEYLSKEVFNMHFSDVIAELTKRGYNPEDIQIMLQHTYSAFLDRAFIEKPHIQLFADVLELVKKGIIYDDSILLEYTASAHPYNDALTLPVQNLDKMPFVKLPDEIGISFDAAIWNAKRMDLIVNNASISQPLKVYRGEGHEVLNSFILSNGEYFGDAIKRAIELEDKAKINKIIAEILGGEITQPRFMSTAYNKRQSMLFVKRCEGLGILWEIDVPKGAKGLYIDPFNSVNEAETEVLFARNRKLRIMDAFVDEDGIFRIFAKMIN